MKRYMGRVVLFILISALILSPSRAVAAPDAGTAYGKLAQSKIAGGGSIFSDVPRDDWAYEDIRKLVGAAIVGQVGGGAAEVPASGSAPVGMLHFRPDDLLTRKECAEIVARLAAVTAVSEAGADTEAGVDMDASASAVTEATEAASASESIPEAESTSAYEYLRAFYDRDGEGLIMPDEPILRGELVTALVKLAGGEVRLARYALLDEFSDADGIERDWRPYAALAIESGILLGHDDGTLQLDRQITRRETCVLIARALGGIADVDLPAPEARELYLPYPDSGFYDAFFNGAVFVGDSITMGLRNYVLSQRAAGNSLLGDARFLVAGSYSIRAAAGDFNPNAEVNMSYQGVEAPIEDCLLAMGAKDVFLMLGMNDRAGATLPDSIENYEKLVDKVYAKNPDINVYIQLCTPVTREREAELLNNVNMDKFNRAIVELCERRGIDWIDVSTPMKDGQNAFKAEYASDGYVHMNSAGSDTWIHALREFACFKYLTGEWSAPAPVAAAPETYSGQYVYIDYE